MEHELESRNGKLYCLACHQTWKGKPRSACSGVPIVKMGKREYQKLESTHWRSQRYWLQNSLVRENLRPITKVACIKQGKEYLYLYDPQGKTKKIDPSLPPVVPPLSCDRDQEGITDTHCLKSEIGLKRLNLIPKGVEPVAVYWGNFNEFVPLYNPLDCGTYIDDFPQVIPRYRYSRHKSRLLDSEKRSCQNLKPKPGAKPLFAFWNYDDWELLYSPKQCKIDDPTLPPVLAFTRYNYKGDCLSDRELRSLNLKPREDMQAIGCYRDCDNWIMLWDIKQCEPIDESLPAVVREIPRGWYEEKDLVRFNRKPDNPIGAIYDRKSNQEQFVLLYKPEYCSIADESLPPVYENIPKQLYKEEDLAQYNLKLGENTVPRGMIWREHCQGFVFLYDKKECDLADPNLPPIAIYDWNFDRSWETIEESTQTRNCLKSELGLKKLNLKPKPHTNPAAVFWRWGGDRFEPLYNPLDCSVRISNLPPIIKNVYSTADLYSDRDLNELNLKPRSDMKPVAVVWNNSTADEDWDYYWDIKQCEPIDESLPPVYPQKPDSLYFEKELIKLNRQVTPQVKPIGCIKKYSGEYSSFYNPHECEIFDPTMPPCYDKDRLPPHLKSEWAWSKVEPLFELSKNAVAAGCFLLSKVGHYEPVFLYDRSQLKIHDREVYLSKTKLKKHYKLSDSWLKRLGKPDKIEFLEINELNVEAHLYSRFRIERFLEDNSEDYLNHLKKRKTYLAIFEKNKDKLLSPQARAKAKQTRKDKKKIKNVVKEFGWDANNKLVREQSLRCLRCASGTVLGGGYVCVINPEGLNLEQLPCIDWQERSYLNK